MDTYDTDWPWSAFWARYAEDPEALERAMLIPSRFLEPGRANTHTTATEIRICLASRPLSGPTSWNDERADQHG